MKPSSTLGCLSSLSGCVAPLQLSSLLLTALLGVAFVTTSTANASISAIIRDCETHSDGQLHNAYSLRDLRHARQNIPADIDEYSDCRDVISRALNAALGRGPRSGQTSAGVGSFGNPAAVVPTAKERGQIERATRGPRTPLRVAGKPILPGAIGLKRFAPRHAIPPAVAFPLSLVGLLGMTTGGWGMKKKITLRRRP